jgi:transcriptional regulator with XRE-family HTH domain
MRTNQSAGRQAIPFGRLLRDWRTARRLSQLALAVEADVSARHLSFLETGRAGASAKMVMRLATVLDVPLRERNLLLQAAGHAPAYRESDLNSPSMADITQALSLILRAHEPFSAWVLDARWRIVMANQPFAEALTLQWETPVEAHALVADPRPNLLALLADRGRRSIRNWNTVLGIALARAYGDALWYRDEAFELEVKAVAAEVGIGADALVSGAWMADSPVVPIETEQDGIVLRFFNTIATLGAPQDVTLQELRIEALHPADADTACVVRELFPPRAIP